MNRRAAFFFAGAGENPIADCRKIGASGSFVAEFSANFGHEFAIHRKQAVHFAVFFGHARGGDFRVQFKVGKLPGEKIRPA